MKYLLDTCVLLWALEDDQAKIAEFRHLLLDERNFIAVSVVTYWEIVIKKALKKLEVPHNIVSVAEETGFNWINLEIKHMAQLEKLPKLQGDPFDRLLIAQAKSEGYKLLTTDDIILRYF